MMRREFCITIMASGVVMREWSSMLLMMATLIIGRKVYLQMGGWWYLTIHVSKFPLPHPFSLLDPSKRELEMVVMDLPPPASYYSVFLSNGIQLAISGFRYCSVFLNNGIHGFSGCYYYEENVMPLRSLEDGKIN